MNVDKDDAQITYLGKLGGENVNFHLLHGSFSWKSIVFQSGIYRRYGAYYEDDRSMYVGASKSFDIGTFSELGMGVNLRHKNPVENGRYYQQECGTRVGPEKITVIDIGFRLKRKNMIWAVSINEIGFYSSFYLPYQGDLRSKSASMSLFRTSHLSGIDLNYGVNLESGNGADFLASALYHERLEIGTGLRVSVNHFGPALAKINLGYRFNRLRFVYTHLLGNFNGDYSAAREHELGITVSLSKKGSQSGFNMF